jgi:hypothetical protein
MLGPRIADCLSADPWYLAMGEGSSFTAKFAMIERRLDALEQRRSG